MKPVKHTVDQINIVVHILFVAHIKREHKTNIFEKQNDDTGPSPPKIIKT